MKSFYLVVLANLFYYQTSGFYLSATQSQTCQCYCPNGQNFACAMPQYTQPWYGQGMIPITATATPSIISVTTVSPSRLNVYPSQVSVVAGAGGITFPGMTSNGVSVGTGYPVPEVVSQIGQSIQQPDSSYPSTSGTAPSTGQYPDYSYPSSGDTSGWTETDWSSQGPDYAYPSTPDYGTDSESGSPSNGYPSIPDYTTSTDSDWTSQGSDYSYPSRPDYETDWESQHPDYAYPSKPDYVDSTESDWASQGSDYGYPSTPNYVEPTESDWGSQGPDYGYPSTPNYVEPTESDWASQGPDYSFVSTDTQTKSEAYPTSQGTVSGPTYMFPTSTVTSTISGGHVIGTTPSLAIVGYPSSSMNYGTTTATMYPTRQPTLNYGTTASWYPTMQPIGPCVPQSTDVKRLMALLTKLLVQQALPNGCEIYKVARSIKATVNLQIAIKLGANNCKEFLLTTNSNGGQGPWSVDASKSVNCANSQAMRLPTCSANVL